MCRVSLLGPASLFHLRTHIDWFSLFPPSPHLSLSLVQRFDFTMAPTEENFWAMVAALETFLRAHHYASSLPSEPWHPLPLKLAEVETYLIRVIHPFQPSERLNLWAHNNAKTWTQATIAALRDHYHTLQDSALTALQNLSHPDWNRALLVAVRRTTQQEPELRDITVTAAHRRLSDIMSITCPPSQALPSTSQGIPEHNDVSGHHTQSLNQTRPSSPILLSSSPPSSPSSSTPSSPSWSPSSFSDFTSCEAPAAHNESETTQARLPEESITSPPTTSVPGTLAPLVVQGPSTDHTDKTTHFSTPPRMSSTPLREPEPPRQGPITGMDPPAQRTPQPPTNPEPRTPSPERIPPQAQRESPRPAREINLTPIKSLNIFTSHGTTQSKPPTARQLYTQSPVQVTPRHLSSSATKTSTPYTYVGTPPFILRDTEARTSKGLSLPIYHDIQHSQQRSKDVDQTSPTSGDTPSLSPVLSIIPGDLEPRKRAPSQTKDAITFSPDPLMSEDDTFSALVSDLLDEEPQPSTSTYHAPPTNTHQPPRKRPGSLHVAALFISHTSQGNKFHDWTLEPRRPWMILGDANLNWLPPIKDVRVQVDCFPGAMLAHGAHIL